MSVLKNNFVVGFTAALAATIVAPVLIPALKRSGRPIAKSLVKGGLTLYDKGREAVANAGEVMEDVIAEVRVEQIMQQAARKFRANTWPRHKAGRRAHSTSHLRARRITPHRNLRPGAAMAPSG